MKINRNTRIAMAVLATVAIVLGLAVSCAPAPTGAGYNTTVHFDSQGAKLVVESGGELEALTGSAIDIQAGTTYANAAVTAFTGTSFDVNVTGAASVDADAASNFNTSVGDLTLESEVGSVNVKGDEAAANAVYLDADEAVGTGVTVASGATAGTVLSGGPVSQRNTATGSVVFDMRDYADTTDDDMAHASLTANCTGTGTGAEECDLGIATVRAGAASTAINVDADAEITLLTETQVELVNALTGNIELVFQDFIDTTDDDMDHAVISANCTNAGTGVEECDLNIVTVRAGAASTAVAIDADGELTLLSENQFELVNAATGSVDLVFQDYIDTTDDDMDHGSIIANCTGTGTGVEECDLSLASVRAGAVSTAITIDADAEMTLLSENQFEFVNAATGNVELVFQDFIDTDDDDMDHVVLVANCTATGTGAEDCDFVVQVVEAGAAPETRFNIDADAGITIGSANNASVAFTAGTATSTYTAPPAAGAGGDIWDITAAFGIADGTDTMLGMDLNLTGANATGTGNVLAGIDIDLTTADPQVQETALLVNDADFDVSIEAGDVPAILTAQTWFLDFLGDTVPAEIVEVSGTDPQALQAMAEEQYGVYQITSGDDGANCAADCEGFNAGLMWFADQGSMVFQARAHIDDITNAICFLGVTDSAALEMPATIGVGTDTPAYVADDAIGFLYDSGSTTNNWFGIGRDETVASTGVGVVLGSGPANGVYEVFRIEIDADGENARLYIDSVLVDTITANAIDIDVGLTPVIICDTNAAASVLLDLDYVYFSAARR